MSGGKVPCPAVGCERHHSHTLFMCINHWRRVHLGTQREIWALYRLGRATTPAYWRTAIAAIEQVARSEGKSVEGSPSIARFRRLIELDGKREKLRRERQQHMEGR